MIAHRHLARIFYAPFPNLIWRQSSPKNTVYLTFDDGPYPPVTRPLLNLLNDRKIPATFFLSGRNVFKYRYEIKTLEYSGHALGNHLFHHVNSMGMGRKTLLREIRLTDALVNRYLESAAPLLRPPYGVFGPAMFPALRQSNKIMVLWSVMANDFKWSAGKILAYLRKSVRPGDIIVFHDSPMTEGVLPEVFPLFLDHCRAKGWGFGVIKS